MSRRRESTSSAAAHAPSTVGSSDSRASPRPVRCAIYTRKSSEDGLDQEFNSLDAQRESAEAYISSQKGSGWVALADRYDDGGYSGGNTDRPALQRLLRDIEAGRVDVVLTYKFDRLSRSLLDFAKLMEAFERYHVSFVSITQRFSTADSMGRLMMNVLLSFAQFEREIIGERIRDKLSALRRKGMWAGGAPVLGYDVDRTGRSPRLVVNAVEAARVRKVFQLYLDLGSLLPVVQELRRLGWMTKATITSTGRTRGGKPFDRAKVHALLTNVTYVGKTRHRKDVHAGEHGAIVTDEVFARVQAQLREHGRGHGGHLRNKHGALLRGLLRCKACDAAMSHVFSGRGTKLYRYYTCCHAIKRGHGTCPTKSLPAAEVERAVVEQVRGIAQDHGLLRETVKQARASTQARLQELARERAALERDLARVQAEVRKVAIVQPPHPIPPGVDSTAAHLATLHERARVAETRLHEIEAEAKEIDGATVGNPELAAAFRGFDDLWNALSPREQGELLRLLVHRVEFDAGESAIEVTFYDTGIKAFAQRPTEVAA